MTIKVIVPAGTYFLGDPCYAVPDNLWNDLLESCDFFQDSAFGRITVDGKEYKVLGFNTAFGDGCYTGSDGFSYGVDAGLIGLTPAELCTDADFNPELGTFITFDSPTVCTNVDGDMRFGDITVDTTDHFDSEYEDDYSDDNYDGDYWDDEE